MDVQDTLEMLQLVNSSPDEITIATQTIKTIEELMADRDRWRSLAERAMDLLDEANRVLAKIQEGLKSD